MDVLAKAIADIVRPALTLLHSTLSQCTFHPNKVPLVIKYTPKSQ